MPQHAFALYPAYPARQARAGHKITPDNDWASLKARKHQWSRVDITGCRDTTDFADHLHAVVRPEYLFC